MGFFGAQILQVETGLSVSWQVCAAIAFLLAVVLASLNIEIGAMVITVAVALEFLVILALDIFILTGDDGDGLPVEVFSPEIGFGSGFAVALI